MQQKEYALIVAGGKGTRIQSSTPKQFIELNGKPVLLHTLGVFFQYDPSLTIVLVLPEDQVAAWKELVTNHKFHHPVILQTGGETRFQSVKRGLEKITGEGLVAIHDGVRPLVTVDIIRESFRLAGKQKTAVAAVPLKESIRMTDRQSSRAVDRSAFRSIQTPQTFDLTLIRDAYKINEDPSLTDDASVAERAGHVISLFEGSYENIKITTDEDLVVAAEMLKKR